MGLFDNVKDLLPKKAETPERNYLALAISADRVEAAVWALVGDQTKILGLGKSDYGGEGDFTKAVGLAIDQAGEAAPGDIQEVIFGLPTAWIKNDQIAEHYDAILKKIAADLELDPLAFVPTVEGIANELHVQELVPPTAILIEVAKHAFTLTILKSGKIEQTIQFENGAAPSQSIADELTKLRNIEVMPSKILLFDGEGTLDKVKGDLLGFNWLSLKFENGEPVFLHFPKIEVLPPFTAVSSVATAAGSDLAASSFAPKEAPSAAEGEEALASGDNFDFLEETDVLSAGKREAEGIGEVVPRRPPVPLAPSQGSQSQAEMAAGRSFFKNLHLPKLPLPQNFRKFVLPTVGIIVTVLLVGLFFLIPQAVVKIYARPQVLERDAQVSVVTGGSPPTDSQIAGKVSEITKSGSQKAVVAGKKTVGDRAKGTVSVFNKTDSSKNFASGTALTAPSGVKFTLDGNVQVASRSAGLEGITYGKATAQATAVDIGTSSNIAGGSDLTIGGFDTSLYVAHNDQAFGGGSSRDVTVVSDDDQKRLAADLARVLIGQARDEINQKTPGQIVLDGAVSSAMTNKKFDKNVGDEASVLTLNLESKMKITSFSTDDLNSALAKLVGSAVPEGFSLNAGEIEPQTQVLSLGDAGDLKLKVHFKVNLLPRLNTDAIATKIAGKSLADAQNFISQIPQVVGSEIEVKPRLPLPLKGIPRLKNRIKIEVTSQK